MEEGVEGLLKEAQTKSFECGGLVGGQKSLAELQAWVVEHPMQQMHDQQNKWGHEMRLVEGQMEEG